MKLLFLLILISLPLFGQNNYEIQVYGYELVPPGHTMFEFHSNFTIEGSKTSIDGLYPTEHQLHETVEITHGFTDYFECGFYIFTNAQSGVGWDWVGDHIRPRFAVPEKWHWPVGVSISNEIGFQRRPYSTALWDWEIRPIVDKQLGHWYFSFNPALDRALQGADTKQGFVFSPNFKLSYDFNKTITGGFEYYGSLGPVTGFDPFREQQQQIFPAIDLNLSPKWEFNAGVGVGITAGTDHLIVKMIIGYRFDL
jgi:Putative MetA-pathway of phenol degradation